MVTRIYHPDLSASLQQGLTPGATHHLVNVLRKQVGDRICLFDGCGLYTEAVLTDVSRKSVQVSISALCLDQPSPVSIHLLQSVCKGDKLDYAIQKAVELGVSEITPIISQRCEVKLDVKRREKKWQHWFKVIVSACEQCGQNWLPRLNPSIRLQDCLARWSERQASRSVIGFVLSPTVSGNNPKLHPGNNSLALLVGPEGGFDALEIERAQQVGFKPWQLGPRVLRTETAGLVAISILQYHLGDMSC